MKNNVVSLLLVILFAVCIAQTAVAADFKIGIMQDKAGAAQQYGPLIALFKAKGIDVRLQGYSNYPDAAMKFEDGNVDAMFAGSGVAGAMMIKNVAYPLLRPVNEEGYSTYWAVVLAPKGAAPFTGDPSYFKGKRIMCSSLASSGEFFARAILGPKQELLKAGSHGIAIDGLANGQADVAIVKNRVWDSLQSKYPDIVQVGQDDGENPDNTLIVSNKTDKELVAKIEAVFLALENDNSAEAVAVRKSMKASRFIPTTEADFSHTLALLEKAGVTKDFNFTY